MYRKGRILVAQKVIQQTDIVIGTGTDAPVTSIFKLGVEIEETGLYEVVYSSVMATGTGAAFNETNFYLYIDGQRTRGRQNNATENSVVAGRYTVDIRHPVVLSEGGHYFEVNGYSFGSTGWVINGSFGQDAQRMEVFRL